MKWINIPINFPSFQDLVQQARDYLRRNLVTVNKFPVKTKYKYLDRTVKRPWHILPSIQGFRIELSPNDWLLTLFGLKKRFPNRMVFDTWKNDDANGYIDYMFNRLSKEVSLKKFDDATKTIWLLMNSTAYQAAALNHVLKNWHRKLPINQVAFIMKDVKKLVKNKEFRLKYARVYLQEKTKLRPLGVPAMSWRIYLHMYNNCIVQWRLETEGNKQHGYLPGRGLITAWQEISRRLNSPNIFEADFKGFFNNVTHEGLHKVLHEELGFPISEADWIKELNRSIPKLTNEDKIPEPDRFVVENSGGAMNVQKQGDQFSIGSRPRGFKRKYAEDEMDVWKAMGLKAPPASWYKSKQKKEVGVPQGAPTSCSLATLALRSLESKYDVIIYADDIIYFPTSGNCNPIKDLTDTFYGIEVNESKSKWLKRNGRWLVESFKFLGIRYFPEQVKSLNIQHLGWLTLQGITSYKRITPARFVAETRKGANLEFTDKESLLSYLAIARELLLDSRYLQKRFSHYSLEKWLITRINYWMKLTNKAKMLFGEAIVIGKDIVSPDYFHSLHPIVRRWLWKERGVRFYKNPLTGYLLSRMQSNTWNISTKQDFTLTYNANSWVATAWDRYSLQWIVPRSKLNVFTASSFAIHDLMDYLNRGTINRRKRKSIIRKVYSRAKSPNWVIEALKLREDFNLNSFRDNVPFTAPEKIQSLDAVKEIHLDIIRPILMLFIILDLIVGFPLLTVLYIWSSRNSRIIVSAEMRNQQ